MISPLLIHRPNHLALGRSAIFASSARFVPVDRCVRRPGLVRGALVDAPPVARQRVAGGGHPLGGAARGGRLRRRRGQARRAGQERGGQDQTGDRDPHGTTERARAGRDGAGGSVRAHGVSLQTTGPPQTGTNVPTYGARQMPVREPFGRISLPIHPIDQSRSCLVSREISVVIMSAAVSSPSTTACTAATIGA